MPISDPMDPVVAEADRRVERAKASLRSRIELLERRFGDIRDRLDVPEHIRRHPWPAIGIALALGALAGRGRPARALVVRSERSGGRTALAVFGGLALRIVRELALAQLGLAARRWLDRNAGSYDRAGDCVDDVEQNYTPGFERYPAP
jgi:hypothetical protein